MKTKSTLITSTTERRSATRVDKTTIYPVTLSTSSLRVYRNGTTYADKIDIVGHTYF